MASGYVRPRDPTQVVGRRVVAYVVDGLIALIAVMFALALVHHDHYLRVPKDACPILNAQSPAPDAASGTICVVVGDQAFVWTRGAFRTAVGAGAFVGMLDLVVVQAITGASIGKLLLGLRVVDDLGRRASLGRVLVRWLLLIVDGGIFLIGLVTALSTRSHRRVGDFVAGTYVVAAESAGRPIGVVSARSRRTVRVLRPTRSAPSRPTARPMRKRDKFRVRLRLRARRPTRRPPRGASHRCRHRGRRRRARPRPPRPRPGRRPRLLRSGLRRRPRPPRRRRSGPPRRHPLRHPPRRSRRRQPLRLLRRRMRRTGPRPRRRNRLRPRRPGPPRSRRRRNPRLRPRRSPRRGGTPRSRPTRPTTTSRSRRSPARSCRATSCRITGMPRETL